MITSIGTYLPPWGSTRARVVGLDEDAVTLAVAAGYAALQSIPATDVRRIVLVSRDFPLLEGGNAGPLLAGLGLSSAVEVREQVGGSPATLDALLAGEPGTVVIGTDVADMPGAAAVFCGTQGAAITSLGRITRSLPVTTRDSFGNRNEYSDPRLLRERGLGESLDQLGLGSKFTAVAGVTNKDAIGLCSGQPLVIPTQGASAALFALAALVEHKKEGSLLAVYQATVTVANVASGAVKVVRDELAPQPLPKGNLTEGSSISVSLPAYERAFDAKLRLEAAKCRTCGTLAYPHRYRCLTCGAEDETDVIALPREANVCSFTTIRVPVPGLVTPYTVVIAELGDSGVRLLVKATGTQPGTVSIDDKGRLVFRLVAVRAGVPDYGYAFLPNERKEATS